MFLLFILFIQCISCTINGCWNTTYGFELSITFDTPISGETYQRSTTPPGAVGTILPLYSSYSPTSFTFQARTRSQTGTAEYEYHWTGGAVTPTSFSGTARFFRYSPTPFTSQVSPTSIPPSPYLPPIPYSASRVPSYQFCTPPVTPKPTPIPTPKPSPGPTATPQPSPQPTTPQPTTPQPTVEPPTAPPTSPPSSPNPTRPPVVTTTTTAPQVYTGTGAAQMGDGGGGGGGSGGGGSSGSNLTMIIGIVAGVACCIIFLVICVARRRRRNRRPQREFGSTATYRTASRRPSGTALAGIRSAPVRSTANPTGALQYSSAAAARSSQAPTQNLTYTQPGTVAAGHYGNLAISPTPTSASGQYGNLTISTDSTGVYSPAGSVRVESAADGVYATAAVRARRSGATPGAGGAANTEPSEPYAFAPYHGAADRAPAPLPAYSVQP
mmetsp:Transcript_10335/g.32705  ORF Transcript_10335/g.32705 Transcript_10335/m.32705 type:complete len:441 (-) Transcript_10335:76-1398(-)